jgi:hypothetical protein
VTASGARPVEELRRHALAVLGEEQDERAVDTLSHGDLAIAWSVARWDSSSGPVEGHRATLTLDAWRLGQLVAHPAVRDAICAALATVIAEQPGHSLLELVTRWASKGRAADAAYRDAPPSRVTLVEAVAEYLDGAGDVRLARAVRGASVENAGGEVVVRGLSGEVAPRVHELVCAVRDLLGDAGVTVRVKP